MTHNKTPPRSIFTRKYRKEAAVSSATGRKQLHRRADSSISSHEISINISDSIAKNSNLLQRKVVRETGIALTIFSENLAIMKKGAVPFPIIHHTGSLGKWVFT